MTELLQELQRLQGELIQIQSMILCIEDRIKEELETVYGEK